MSVDSLPVTLDHVYILGWYDEDGEISLTSWDGDAMMIDVVILGLKGRWPPVWNSPIPTGVEIVPVPNGANPHEFAREIGGIFAFGWHLPQKIDRDEKSNKSLS